jgi:integrase/recombinase XerC
VQADVAKVAQVAKLEGVTPHTLRHTFGKGLIDQGVDLVTVKTLMGHKRLDSTAHYTKPSVSDLEGAVARLATEEA